MEQLTQTTFEQQLPDKIVIFKHSNRCPVSKRARKTVQSCTTNNTIPIYEIVVQEQRELSDTVAEQTGIEHETPQLLYIENGEVAWHASHNDITKQALRDNVPNIN